MKTLITICARGGSKGIPGKNIKSLNGNPLIYYSLKVADAFAANQEGVSIFLSTDSKLIKETVVDLEIESVRTDYDRPEHLSTDAAGKMGVIADVLIHAEEKENCTYDYIIDLDVTSPLRSLQDIENCLLQLKQNPEALNIFSVNPANRNPYFNMVEEREGSNFVKLVKEGNFVTRQSAPSVYDVNASIYVYRREFFTRKEPSAMTQRSLIYIMSHVCFDLDHPIDFDFMSYLLENQKLDFEFTQ